MVKPSSQSTKRIATMVYSMVDLLLVD
jgi:hypothetical protein